MESFSPLPNVPDVQSTASAPRYRIFIRNAAGEVIRRTRNLRGIYRHAAQFEVWRVFAKPMDRGGRVEFQWRNGDVAIVHWADWRVMLGALRRWRSLYNADLFWLGVCVGKIGGASDSIKEVWSEAR